MILQLLYPVPVRVIYNERIAAARDMSSMMPACKRNTDTVTAIAFPFRSVAADRAFMCIWDKQFEPNVMPVPLSEFICIFTDGIYYPVIRCIPDFLRIGK